MKNKNRPLLISFALTKREFDNCDFKYSDKIDMNVIIKEDNCAIPAILSDSDIINLKTITEIKRENED